MREVADRVAELVVERVALEFRGFWCAEDLVEELPAVIRDAFDQAIREAFTAPPDLRDRAA